MYVHKQERRNLLKKKTNFFPEEPRESRQTNNDCSLKLCPNPDRGLFGNREESEEESSSAESESEDSKKREGSDASSGDPVEPEGDNWTLVTSRGWGSERLSSPSSIGWSKHIIRVRSNFFNPRSTSLFNKAYSVCL